MKKGISIAVVLLGIALFAVGLYLKVPGSKLTLYSSFDGVDNYSAVDAYVGGDAYNFIIGASLIGGEIAGTLVTKAIYIAIGALIFCAGLMGFAFAKKEDATSTSTQVGSTSTYYDSRISANRNALNANGQDME